MGAMGFTSVVLMLSSFAFAINADCSNEDLESKLFMCRDQADDIINSNQCSGIESKVELISNCFSGCEAIPSAIADESKKLMDSINTAVGSRCHDLSNSVHARVERSLVTCQMTEISSCAVFCELVIDIPTNARIGSLRENCSNLDITGENLEYCHLLVSNCFSDEDESKHMMDRIRYAGKIVSELQNNGCTCITQIESSVSAYEGLPQDEKALQLICADVQEKTRLVKKVMDICADINAAVGLTLDWLAITIGSINIVNSFVTSVCGTYDLLKN